MPNTVLSPPPGQFLLELTSPAVRSLLIRERVLAMEGRAEAAHQSLDDAIQLVSDDRPRDAVALGLLKAELLHLDFLHEDALAFIVNVVGPHLSSLTAEERFGVEYNLTDVQLYTLK